MRIYLKFVGIIALLSLARPCGGETIPFSDFPKDNAANNSTAIHITPTGPDNFPVVQGDWEVLGATAPFLNNSITSRYYSAIATFDQPVTSLTLDVIRVNNSGWDNPIKLIAFDNGKRVKSVETNIAPLGDTTRITISAPSIDKFEWGGDGWVFHPFVIRGLQVTFAAAVTSDPPATPSVGAVPEPGSIGMLAVAGGLALVRRRAQ